MFMNTQTDYIWTMNGTLADECVMCKVEEVLTIQNSTVKFWRNYTFDKINISKLLLGEFIKREGEPPNSMRITVLEEHFVIGGVFPYSRPHHKYTYVETLVHAEKGQTCGVFLHRAQKYLTVETDTEFYFRRDDQSCEVRVKARYDKKPSAPPKSCMEKFERLCRRKPYFAVYRSFCKMP